MALEIYFPPFILFCCLLDRLTKGKRDGSYSRQARIMDKIWPFPTVRKKSSCALSPENLSRIWFYKTSIPTFLTLTIGLFDKQRLSHNFWTVAWAISYYKPFHSLEKQNLTAVTCNNFLHVNYPFSSKNIVAETKCLVWFSLSSNFACFRMSTSN